MSSPARNSAAAVLLAAAALFSAGAASAEPAAEPCGPELDRVHATAEALVRLGPRPDSSETSRRAGEEIAAELEAAGLEPRSQLIGEIAVPRIAVGSWLVRPGGTRVSNDRNLWVRFDPEPGARGAARLFLAHYDSVPGSPGAADNAAAVGLLVELARCLERRPPPAPVIIAFTGGEEVGLLGARRLAASQDDLELAVSLDLVGHQTPLALNGLSARWSHGRLAWLAERVRQSGAEAYAPLVHRLVSRRWPQLERSDHGPFSEAGVPALHLYGRGARRIYLPYHTRFDDMSRLSDAALGNAFALAAELAYDKSPLPAAEDDLGMWLPASWRPLVISERLTTVLEWVAAGLAVAFMILALWAGGEHEPKGGAGLIACAVVFILAWLAVVGVFWLERRIHGVPLSFAHQPLRFEVGMLTAACGVAGLAALALGSRWQAAGGTRYHLAAAIVALASGLVALVLGAFELAWLPLGAALAFALAAVAVDLILVNILATAAGVALYLPAIDPRLVREATFHGFFPPALPLPVFLAAVLLPAWLATWGVLANHLPGPRRAARWAMAGALLAATTAGIFAVVAPAPPCSSEASSAAGLSCELGD